VTVLFVFMLEFNRGLGLLFGFVMYLMTLSVSGLYISSLLDK
jgi:hypothetical protein